MVRVRAARSGAGGSGDAGGGDSPAGIRPRSFRDGGGSLALVVEFGGGRSARKPRWWAGGCGRVRVRSRGGRCAALGRVPAGVADRARGCADPERIAAAYRGGTRRGALDAGGDGFAR